MKETEQLYDGKLLHEKDVTQRKIDEINEKLSHEYVPVLNVLNQRIIKAEQQRGISLEQLHKSSLESTESNESEIMEMNKRHQEERAKIRAEIRKEKQKLQDLLAEREADVEQLKQNLEKQVKDAQNEFENTEKRHVKQVNEILDDFAQIQREYDEDTARRIQEKDQKRAEEVERLKNEHQLRVNEIIYQIEQKTTLECEKAYNEGVKEAQIIHQQELAHIKTRINDYNQSIEDTRNSMALLKINHEERMKRIEINKNQESEDRINFLKDDFEQEKNFLYQQKRVLMMQLKQMKKKKVKVEEKFDEVKQQLDEMNYNGPIATPLEVLRQSLGKVIIEMRHQEADLLIDKRNLENQIGELQNKVDEIGKKADEKQTELDQFMHVKQENLHSYFESIRKNMENTFEKVKKKPIEYENSRIPLRKEIDDEIAELQTDLLQQRKEAEIEVSNLITDKDAKLNSLEQTLQNEFEDRIQNLREEHELKMKKLTQEYDDLKKSHELKMMEIKKKHENDLIEAENIFKKRKVDLQDEQKNLYLKEKDYQEKIEETPIPQCTDCNVRRETINRLTCRRNELLDRLSDLTNTSIQNDQKVSSLFPQRIGSNSIPSSKSSLGLSHSPRAVLRSKTSLKKTIVTPHHQQT